MQVTINWGADQTEHFEQPLLMAARIHAADLTFALKQVIEYHAYDRRYSILVHNGAGDWFRYDPGATPSVS